MKRINSTSKQSVWWVGSYYSTRWFIWATRFKIRSSHCNFKSTDDETNHNRAPNAIQFYYSTTIVTITTFIITLMPAPLSSPSWHADACTTISINTIPITIITNIIITIVPFIITLMHAPPRRSQTAVFVASYLLAPNLIKDRGIIWQAVSSSSSPSSQSSSSSPSPSP